MAKSFEELEIFSRVAAKGFEIEDSLIPSFQKVITPMMQQEKGMHFLAYIDGVAVGTATLHTCKASAGVWNLTTLPEYRNQGAASALVKAALLEAKRRHYHHVMAILMPDGMAWGLFIKLGFQEACQFPFYIHLN